MRTVSPGATPSSCKRFSTPIFASTRSKRASAFVGFEVRHRGETFDALAGDDERAVVAALDDETRPSASSRI